MMFTLEDYYQRDDSLLELILTQNRNIEILIARVEFLNDLLKRQNTLIAELKKEIEKDDGN